MAEATIASSRPLLRERNLILGSLLALAAAAWGVLIWQSATMEGDMSLTMGMSPPLWIALWIAMMVAIMFPTAAPMVLMFARVHAKRQERGQPFVPTWVFASSYLLQWSFAGVVAYALAVGGDEIADQSMWVMDNAARIGGVVLIAAGVYQLSPLKYVCLNKCRTPMSFILNSWRDGRRRSFLMGLEHGVYCFGCCWLLFPHPLPVGDDEHRHTRSRHPADFREEVAAGRTLGRFRGCRSTHRLRGVGRLRPGGPTNGNERRRARFVGHVRRTAGYEPRYLRVRLLPLIATHASGT